MPEGNPGFFDPATTTLGPEPPGFDILREMLVRQIIDQKQNPYGMSQEGMGNIQGPLFSGGVKNAPGLGYMGMGTAPPPGGGGPVGGGQPPTMPRGMPMQAQRRGMPRGAMGMGQRPVGLGGSQHQPPQSGWFWELLRQLGPNVRSQRQPQQVMRDGVSYDGWSGTPDTPTPVPQPSTPLPAPGGSWNPQAALARQMQVQANNPAMAGQAPAGEAYRAFQTANGPRPGDAAGAHLWDARLGASAGQGAEISDMPGWRAMNYASAGHGAPAMMIGPQGQMQFPQNTNQGYIKNSMTPNAGGGWGGAPMPPKWSDMPSPLQPQQPMGPYRPPPRTIGPRPGGGGGWGTIEPWQGGADQGPITRQPGSPYPVGGSRNPWGGGVQQRLLPSNIGPGPSRVPQGNYL